MGPVKTTLELPDDLMREIKIQAAREGRKLKDVVTDLLRKGLASKSRSAYSKEQAKLPLIRCAHAAAPDEEMTPERAFEVLLAQEISQASIR
jgi:plasmid stability protein